MKKSVFFLFILYISFVQFSNAQIIAGSPSAGLIISDPNINLSVSTVGNTVSGIFDLDCDSVADMQVNLYKGATAIDGGNMAFLYVLNPAFEICADTGTTTLRDVYYFNLGDTLVSPDSTYWASDSIYKLGDFGCMDCPGPYSGSNLFIAYRNTLTSQVGWIKISFSLFDPSPILSIPEILSPCLNTELPMGGGGLSGTATCGVFTYSYTINPPSCEGFCDGSISITSLSGGTPSYSYFWNDPSLQTTPSAIGLCPGVYTVSFEDAVGNFCAATFVLPNGPPISFSFITTNVTCNGICDGTICATGITGGTPPYTYIWMPVVVTTQCFSGACSGTYTLCITDAIGCQACSTVVVSEPTPINVSFIVSNVSCNSGSDGSICPTVTGGVAPYVYSWTPGGVASACFPSASPFTYTLCVTDMNGCQVCSTAIVSEPSLVQATELITNASCSTCCDGDAQLTPSGGSPPYTFLWLSSGQTGDTLSNQCPGTYNYCVTDANGCSYCDSVTVSFSLGIASSGFDNNYNIYPNPFNNSATIEISTEHKIKYDFILFDQLGREVRKILNIAENKIIIERGDLNSGIYFYKVTTIEKIIGTGKIIIN